MRVFTRKTGHDTTTRTVRRHHQPGGGPRRVRSGHAAVRPRGVRRPRPRGRRVPRPQSAGAGPHRASSSGSATRCRWWRRTAPPTAASSSWSKRSTRWPAGSAAAHRSRSRCRRTGVPGSSAPCAAPCATSPACPPAGCPPRSSRTRSPRSPACGPHRGFRPTVSSVVRLRRQRHQHHAGRRGCRAGRHRRHGQVPGLLRRPRRPGAAQPRRHGYRGGQLRRSGQHRRGRIAQPPARRVPQRQGTAVRRDRHRGPGGAARVHVGRPGHAARTRGAHRRTARRSAVGHRGDVAALPNSAREHLRGRDGRRWRRHSAGHPAALGAVARAGRHGAAADAVHRRGCRGRSATLRLRRRADGHGTDAAWRLPPMRPTGMAPTMGWAAGTPLPGSAERRRLRVLGMVAGRRRAHR